MDHELIRSWLQLPPGDWPPDHYTLLGLAPAECDVARIEQQVHERMQRLRSYQLTHPDPATEAMNCLARALVCLTDPDARKAYDRELASKLVAGANVSQTPSSAEASMPAPFSSQRDLAAASSSPPADRSEGPSNGPAQPREAESPAPVPPATEDQRFVDWQTAPPPRRLPREVLLPAPLEVVSKETTENLVLPGVGAVDTTTDAPPVPSTGSEAPPPGEEVLASFSRRGLRSKRTLYYQIARTRQLIWAWEQVGTYLGRPTRFVSRPSEATDLIHHMGVIRELLPSALPQLGEAGQPGYLVLALARQQMIVPTLQTLLPSQREALARDWQAGQALLRSVRQFLRQELRVVSRRRGWRYALRLLGAGLSDHPGMILLVLAWVAINLAFPPLLERWPEQLICILALAGIKLALWLYWVQPLHISSISQFEPRRRLPRKRPRARQPDSSRA